MDSSNKKALRNYMKICELISEDLIIPELQGKTKKQVLEEMVSLLALKEEGIDAMELLKVLMEREKLGSTGIGNGIAIPHGKLRGISQLVVAFGKSSQGVDFDSMDGKPVHLFFLLVAPENSAGAHLKALARLSRLLKDNSFRKKLIGVSESQSLYRTIVQEDEKY
jgi:PTS system nitrogen regulatory IIA component